jgi:hypothetical protein
VAEGWTRRRGVEIFSGGSTRRGARIGGGMQGWRVERETAPAPYGAAWLRRRGVKPQPRLNQWRAVGHVQLACHTRRDLPGEAQRGATHNRVDLPPPLPQPAPPKSPLTRRVVAESRIGRAARRVGQPDLVGRARHLTAQRAHQPVAGRQVRDVIGDAHEPAGRETGLRGACQDQKGGEEVRVWGGPRYGSAAKQMEVLPRALHSDPLTSRVPHQLAWPCRPAS